jgi:hypothetical protein
MTRLSGKRWLSSHQSVRVAANEQCVRQTWVSEAREMCIMSASATQTSASHCWVRVWSNSLWSHTQAGYATKKMLNVFDFTPPPCSLHSSLKLSSFISLLASCFPFPANVRIRYHRFTFGTTIAGLRIVSLSQEARDFRHRNRNWLPARWFSRAACSPARFALALSISIPRFYPAWAGVSVGVPHFSGKWESIWRTSLRNCTWQHALRLSPDAIGSSLWCPIPADQALAPFFRHPDLLTLVHRVHREISFKRDTCARCFPIFSPSFCTFH